MAHSRIVHAQMLDIIAACAASGVAMPTDADIVDRFDLAGTESARTLLAELADAGKITVDWKSDPRRITLGAKKPSTLAPARPVAASVVKRDESGSRVLVDGTAVLAKPFDPHAGVPPKQASRIDQIRAAAARLDQRSTTRTPPRPELTGVEPGTTDTTARPPLAATPMGRADTAEQAPDRQVGAPARPAVASPSTLPAGANRPVQVNIKVPPAAYAELVRRGIPDRPASAIARELIVAVLAEAPVAIGEPEPTFARGEKPRISAAVIRDEMPLDRFVTMLIERGFASYEIDAARERAA